jgi:beta-galactosidase
MVDARGRRMNHGGREHATWSSPVYRRYVERIVGEMVRRFGANPAVWGWQIDNELSHYGAPTRTRIPTARASGTG